MRCLGILVDRGRDAGDIERLWTVLQYDELCKLGVEPMKPLLYVSEHPARAPAGVRAAKSIGYDRIKLAPETAATSPVRSLRLPDVSEPSFGSMRSE